MGKKIIWVAETSENTPWNRRVFSGRGAASAARAFKKDIEAARGEVTVSLYPIQIKI